MQHTFRTLVLGSALVAASAIAIPTPAKADTASTLLIAAGAAAIVGAILVDANNHPYYVNNNRRYYVTQNEVTYYRAHHQVVQRQAWVPENEYPVQRNAGYQVRPTQVARATNQRPSAHNQNNKDNQGRGR